MFLASEILFFGALMLTYTVCRVDHPDAFAAAGRETNIWYGTINTAVLLTSSLTMAIARRRPPPASTFVAWCSGAWRRLQLWDSSSWW